MLKPQVNSSQEAATIAQEVWIIIKDLLQIYSCLLTEVTIICPHSTLDVVVMSPANIVSFSGKLGLF